MVKILLVEDAPDIQFIVKAVLANKFDLKCVASAEEAIREIAETSYALMILDVSLPGEDGFKLCANIRADEKHKYLPIVFLTSRQETRDKVLAFSLGADDYITKPIDTAEFRARIEAKMRRIQSAQEEKDSVSKGPFRIALAEQKIFVETKGELRDMELSTIEFKLFYYFLRHEEHVLTREQILNDVWGASVHVSDRVVDTYIYTLRKKLGPLSSIVKSVPRMGYKLSLSKTTQVA